MLESLEGTSGGQSWGMRGREGEDLRGMDGDVDGKEKD